MIIFDLDLVKAIIHKDLTKNMPVVEEGNYIKHALFSNELHIITDAKKR